MDSLDALFDEFKTLCQEIRMKDKNGRMAYKSIYWITRAIKFLASSYTRHAYNDQQQFNSILQKYDNLQEIMMESIIQYQDDFLPGDYLHIIDKLNKIEVFIAELQMTESFD